MLTQGTMRHVQLLLQSLLSAFTRDEPYVSKFLFHFVLNRGGQPSGVVGLSPVSYST